MLSSSGPTFDPYGLVADQLYLEWLRYKQKFEKKGFERSKSGHEWSWRTFRPRPMAKEEFYETRARYIGMPIDQYLWYCQQEHERHDAGWSERRWCVACGLEVVWYHDGARLVRDWTRGGNFDRVRKWATYRSLKPLLRRLPVDWTDLPNMDVDSYWPPCRGRKKKP